MNLKIENDKNATSLLKINLEDDLKMKKVQNVKVSDTRGDAIKIKSW
jgi:hypothetical protein